MYAFVVSVTLACLAQVAIANPDFGIQGTVPKVSLVKQKAVLAKEHFLRVDDYVMPSQKSDITKLRESVTILQAIGLRVNTLGPGLMDAITTTSEDSGGNVENTFTMVSIARLQFEDYISVNLQEQIQNLETLLGIYVRDQLVDDFFHIQVRLTALSASLATLQAAISQAYTAANGGPVSAALIQQFVDEALVTNLVQELTQIAYRIPVLTYTITSSLANIKQADDYYYGLKQDTDRILGEIATTGSDFYTNTIAYSSQVEQSMNAIIESFSAELTAATGTATELNVAELTAAISGLNAVENTKLAATLKAYKDLYDANVLELSKLLPLDANFAFLPNGNPAAVLVGVLIANGPFSRYCFWKYSAVLHNMLLVSNYASECYDREYARLQLIQQALLIEIELISYDLEVVNPYSQVCRFLPSSVSQRTAECAKEIAGYFSAMSGAFDKKLSDFVSLAETELKASKQRLSVCWTTRVQQTLVKFQDVLKAIQACAADGPKAAID
ncbi:uncharacterized protein LOC128725056 [Anopheles nili]|uniref:uncharacterized protein LOC128725056 n=1 Tax=Anopheles nili TaxID=185578 RepID=UPI00237C2CCC|nr:uncharacterized protein LOC128725056 [Anopheles nili]